MMDFQQVEVLLVEDNPADAELAMRALKKRNLANHITWLKDGAEAVDFLFATGAYADRSSNNLPRMVLLDLKLPKLDGIDVLKRMKQDERLKMIPVVMMTSSREERDVVESYKLGVNSYLVKPVDFDKFAEVVSTLGLYWLILNKAP